MGMFQKLYDIERKAKQENIPPTERYALRLDQSLPLLNELGNNNFAKNAIRPLALEQKNYLFAGSARGAGRATMFYSFFETCKKNNVNPYE